MKTGLVLGAIAPFCDLVKDMEELNIQPILCDYYVDAPAKKMGHIAYDVSTTNYEEILKLAKKHNVDGIVSAFSDRNLDIACRLADELHLPQLYNNEIISLVTDKMAMKDFFSGINLPIIKHKIIGKDFRNEEVDDMDFPVVTKPIDAYGSKGIFVCNNADEIRQNFDRTADEALNFKDRIIIEEFYPVDEISVTAWVKEGKAYVTCIYDVIKNYEPKIELAAVAFPSKYTNEHISNITKILNKIIAESGIKEGPVTLQCFIGEKGLKVSELLFRLAGNSPYLYGVYLGGPNIAKMLLQFDVGDKIDYQNLEEFVPLETGSIYYDIQVFAMKSGRITYNFTIDEIKDSIKECVDVRLYQESGDVLVNVPDSGKMYARIICKAKSYGCEDYYAILDKIRETVHLYDEHGDDVCFVRRAQEIRSESSINWDFNK